MFHNCFPEWHECRVTLFSKSPESHCERLTSYCHHERFLRSEFFCHPRTFSRFVRPAVVERESGNPVREQHRLRANVKLSSGFPIEAFGNDRVFDLTVPLLDSAYKRDPEERDFVASCPTTSVRRTLLAVTACAEHHLK